MFSVSYTTRKPRGNEVDGQRLLIHLPRRVRGDASHATSSSSTPRFSATITAPTAAILDEARHAGQGPGTRHRRPRCETIERARFPEAVTIFILAPSRQILEQRLRARSEDREEVIERRLREAAEEIRKYDDYDYVLINHELANRPRLWLRSCAPNACGESGSKIRSGRYWRHFEA